MSKNNDITIRKATASDLKNLKRFFIEAYGMRTIFQNEQFLQYYFNSRNDKESPLSAIVIGVTPKGKIVSHYGGLYYQLKLSNKTISVIWGVNAYTLPEWRGNGYGSEMVKFIVRNNESNAVIGMPFEAPHFYKKLGYNIFNKDTLQRFAYVLDAETYNVIQSIGQNIKKAKRLLPIQGSDTIVVKKSNNIVALTKNNFNHLDLDIDIDSIVSTHRSREFLNWRFIENPYIDYTVYGYLKNHKIISYIALREETLSPFTFTVTRIIDLFGKIEGIKFLLDYTIDMSFSRGHIYIDFSMYGKLYEKQLIESGYVKLENNDVCLLPQVTSPVENRPNHEFIVLQSKAHNELFQSLSKERVYFTRMDGDRDRIAKISQIKPEY